MKRWEVLEGLIKSDDLKSFAEIGVRDGETTGYILKNCPGVQVYACDPWVVQPPDPLHADAETYEAWDFAAYEAKFRERTDPYRDRLTFHRATGNEMAATLADESIGVVFIDARHDYPSVMNDISTWWPKVQFGGFLALDDFKHKFPGVMNAVADHFDLMTVIVLPDNVCAIRKM